MRRAIAAIDAAGDTPLPLSALAADMNMSPAHFQRLFSTWVGVSPKRYQQYLTLGHAKALLRERFTTLETAHSVGLSGSGRLHDLFVKWEAMSPGDYARRTVTAPLLQDYKNLTASTAQNSRSEPKRTGRSAALLPSRNVVNWGFQPIALQGEKPPSKRGYEV